MACQLDGVEDPGSDVCHYVQYSASFRQLPVPGLSPSLHFRRARIQETCLAELALESSRREEQVPLYTFYKFRLQKRLWVLPVNFKETVILLKRSFSKVLGEQLFCEESSDTQCD